jgi:hypothetical protein
MYCVRDLGLETRNEGCPTPIWFLRKVFIPKGMER